jgi:hypothetical protein
MVVLLRNMVVPLQSMVVVRHGYPWVRTDQAHGPP